LKRLSQGRRDDPRGPSLANLPRIGMHISATVRLLTLFAHGATTDEAIANLKVRIAIVKQQLYCH
jgi:hypothetical protein